MRINVIQQRIIELAAEGLSEKQIADRIFRSKSTVRWNLQLLYKQCGFYGAGSRFQLLKFCNFIGLVKL